MKQKCCPICYKVGGSGTSHGESEYNNLEESHNMKLEEVQQRFFRLLERYLNGGRNGSDGMFEDGMNCEKRFPFPLAKFAEIGMLSCTDCFRIMESFCKLFHQLKTIELNLEWHVQKLKGIMMASQRVKSRMRYFREFIWNVEMDDSGGGWNGPAETMGTVVKSKKLLIAKCSERESSSFPKLEIPKCDSDAVTDAIIQPAPTMLLQLSQSVSTGEVEPDSTSNVGCEDDEGSPTSSSTNDLHALIKNISVVPETNEEGGEIEKGSLSPEAESTIQNEIDPATEDLAPDNSPRPETPITPDIDPTTLPPADTPEESSLTENSGKKFGLRAKHRCDHCKKTFSSLERLNSHVRECLQETSEMNIVLVSDNEGDLVSDNDDNMSLSSSSSEDDDALDMDDDEEPNVNDNDNANSNTIDISDAGSEDSSDKTQKFREVVVTKQTSLRLKCPDCNELFLSFKAFLVHRQDSESCKPFYDPTTSVKVEVLSRPLNYKETGDAEADKQSFNKVALIDLPQTIFICLGCGLALYSSEDLDKHKAIHGSFSCQFCKFKCSYAPALSRHEFQHSIRKMSFEDTGHATPCPRCDVKFRNIHDKAAHINHHLKEHLSANLHEPSCAICKTTYKKLGLLELVEHLKSHHDLTNNNNPERCSMDTCKAYYLTKEQLQEHLKICHDYVHVEEKKGNRKCRDCGETFQNLLLFREHQLLNHAGSSAKPIIKCPEAKCPRIFESEKDVEIHMKKKHSPSVKSFDIKKLTCPDCNLLFTDVKGLLLHRKELKCGAKYDPTTSIRVEIIVTPNDEANLDELQEKPVFAVVDLPQEMYICEECGLEVFSLEDKEAHDKLHGSFTCTFCKAKRTYAPDMAKHERKHAERQTYGSGSKDKKVVVKCPRCDFKCSGRLAERYIPHHLKVHMSLPLLETVCAICKAGPKADRRKFKLAEHLKQFHDLSNAGESLDKVRRCTVVTCNAYFLTRRQLRDHLMSRHAIDMDNDKRKNKCQDCGKCYRDVQMLRKHRLQFHVDSNKVIPCVFENCSTVFETKLNLINHIMSVSSYQYHLPIDNPQPGKEVQCPSCEAAFDGNDPKFLVEHMQSKHREGKLTHVCEFCGKDFKYKASLEEHRNFHHYDKESWNFSCTICSKRYVCQFRLNRHMNSHSNEKLFICQLCGLKYAFAGGLKVHMNNKHKDAVQGDKGKSEKTNLVSRKGIKRKIIEEETEDDSSTSSDDSDAV